MPYSAYIPATSAAQSLQKMRVEAMGASVAPFLPAEEHGLLRAVHLAYALHHPLALSPDAIWLSIAQGFAAHLVFSKFVGVHVADDGEMFAGGLQVLA